MQYALGTETGAFQSYTTSMPTITNAGSYHVWYKVEGDGNHNDTVAQKVSITITKAEAAVPTIESKAYTGQKQTADVAASDRYNVTTNAGGTDVGYYSVVLTQTDADNYKWGDSTDAAKTLQFQITMSTANTMTVDIKGRQKASKQCSDCDLRHGDLCLRRLPISCFRVTRTPRIDETGHSAIDRRLAAGRRAPSTRMPSRAYR